MREMNYEEDILTKEKLLTKRFNNYLSLVLGLTFFVYGIVALSTAVSSSTSSFIGLLIVGAIY